MKLEQKVGNVFLSENLVSHKFRVKINRQSFKLLYGDLYSDKVRAIIRELSTNANDSHIAAGKADAPFEVHLPSDLEPYFYVRDFGTGLSPDQICGEDGIYITFCDSNKSNSDDYTGCLGLGSKSPLSYTDNFTVESNYNGLKYSYAVFMDAEGQPSITPLGSCETDEPNGMKIEFPVKESDYREFAGKAAEVLSWFKLRPRVIGEANFEFESHEYLHKTDRYGIRKERQNGSLVIMSNVAYPVDADDFTYNKINDIERAVLDWGVDLFVDIGDVEFVPSREKLSLTEKTIANVKKYLAEAIQSIKEELEAQVSQVPTVWQARRMLHDIKHSILGKVRSLDSINYHGKEISQVIQFHATVQKTMPTVDRASEKYPKLEMVYRRKEAYRRRDEESIICDGTTIFVNDLERGGWPRIRNHVANVIGRSAYMISGVDAAFLEETGIGEVAILASSLPVPEREARRYSGGGRGVTKRTVVQQYNPTDSNYMVDWWQNLEVDLRDGGVYVVVSYGQIVEDNGSGGTFKRGPQEIKRVYKALLALRPDFKLLAIRPADLPKMEKYKNRWIKFDDYVNSVLNMEMPKHIENIHNARRYEEVSHTERYDKFVNEQFEEYSKFGQFLEKLKNAKEASITNAEVQAVIALNQCVKNSFVIPETTDLYALSKEEQELSEVYPLFECLEWYRYGRDNFIQSVSEYIRAMDNRILDAELMRKEAV